MEKDRMELVIYALIEMLENAGFSDDQIKADLNSIESRLTQGVPQQALTSAEEVFLFGED